MDEAPRPHPVQALISKGVPVDEAVEAVRLASVTGCATHPDAVNPCCPNCRAHNDVWAIWP